MPRLPTTVIAICAGLAAGCASAGDGAVDGPPRIDADPFAPDADPTAPDADRSVPDADPNAADAEPHVEAGHLLLSEVAVTPNAAEYIEIVNPTGAAIDLDDYYLSDNAAYFTLPTGTPTLDNSDFIVKFPAGASIPAGGVATVAMASATDFGTAYPGVTPTFSVQGGATTMITIVATAGSTLTNGGEVIALFTWDGASDLVTDVDLMQVGAPSAANQFTSKTGVAQDGPDAGPTTSTYAPDANALPTTVAPAMGMSIKRILGEAGHESQAGVGNGVNGDDETSEQLGTTWDVAATAANPGTSSL